jgi:uracil-DNA glycosylase family 4
MANTRLNSQQQSAYAALGLGPIWFLKQAASATGLAACSKCDRKNHRNMVVQTQLVEDDSTNIRAFVLGTEPSELADQSGQSFSGVERQLIEQLLLAIGISPSQISLGYQVKCKAGPLTNWQSAAVACSDWFKADVEKIRPTFVIVFGELFEGSKQTLGDLPIFQLPRLTEILQSAAAKAKTWRELRKLAALKFSDGLPS